MNVKQYLWGTTYSWQTKLNITRGLPTYGRHQLTDVASYTVHNRRFETGDCFYCNICGEKTLFFALAFTMDACLECDTAMRASNSNR